MRHLGAVVLLFCLACGDGRAPVQPTPALIAPTPPVFSLSGSVADTASRPLHDSSVEVIDGQRVSTVTTTDETGRFSMPGTFTGAITIIASKDGYVPQTRPFPPPNRPLPPTEGVARWELSFHLGPDGPSANIAGLYTLTLTADSACTKLPDEARTRIYTATIAAASGSTTSFLAQLSDARFFSTNTNNAMDIGIAGDFARISNGSGIVERLQETTYLVVGGEAAASFGPSGISAPFDGYFQYCPSAPAWTSGEYWDCQASVQCDSRKHKLTLVRR